MTTHSWGENPYGKWVLEVYNGGKSEDSKEPKLISWNLELYGIQADPNRQNKADFNMGW